MGIEDFNAVNCNSLTYINEITGGDVSEPKTDSEERTAKPDAKDTAPSPPDYLVPKSTKSSKVPELTTTTTAKNITTPIETASKKSKNKKQKSPEPATTTTSTPILTKTETTTDSTTVPSRGSFLSGVPIMPLHLNASTRTKQS